MSRPKETLRIIVRLACVSACAFLFACASKKVWIKPDRAQLEQWHTLSRADDYPDAGAVILLDEGTLEVHDGSATGYGLMERHSVVKICNSRGYKYANIVIPYSPSTKVTDIQARAISPRRIVSLLKEENIFDVSFYPNFIFYSDHRAKMFTVPGVEDGSLIECRYTIEIYNRTYRHVWKFQADEPTLCSRFTLVAPSKWTVKHHLSGIVIDPEIQKNPAGFKDTYTWEAEHLPPLKTEIGMPPAKEVSMRLSVAPMGFATWKDVSRWYAGLTRSRIAPGDSIRVLAGKLTTDMDEPVEKLRSIYEWIRDHIRYIAVEIGIGGYDPHPAEEVLQNRYGDCKDMAVLLCAMSREAGIHADMALVSTWQNGVPDTVLPTPNPFNHAIVFCPDIGEKGLWLDATAKGCPFGQLPWFDQGLPALTARAEGGSLRITPEALSGSNRIVNVWNIQLSPSGEASVTAEGRLFGSPASSLRQEFLPTSAHERREWLERFLARRCYTAQLDSFRITGINSRTDPLHVRYGFHAEDFAQMHGDLFALTPWTAVWFNLPDLFQAWERVHPVRLRFGSHQRFEWNMKLPWGYSMKSQSFSDSLSSDFGKAIWSARIQDGIFITRRTLILAGDDVPPHAYPEFREFLQEVRTRDLTAFLFIKEK